MSLSFRKASYEPGVVEFGNGSFAYLQPDGGWGFSNAGLVTDGGEALLVDTMFDTAHTRRDAGRFQEGDAARRSAPWSTPITMAITVTAMRCVEDCRDHRDGRRGGGDEA